MSMAACMGEDQVLGVERLAPQLGVEIGAAGGEAAGLQDLVIGQRTSGTELLGNWSVSQPDW
jgi:hypothetical protein